MTNPGNVIAPAEINPPIQPTAIKKLLIQQPRVGPSLVVTPHPEPTPSTIHEPPPPSHVQPLRREEPSTEIVLPNPSESPAHMIQRAKDSWDMNLRDAAEQAAKGDRIALSGLPALQQKYNSTEPDDMLNLLIADQESPNHNLALETQKNNARARIELVSRTLDEIVAATKLRILSPTDFDESLIQEITRKSPQLLPKIRFIQTFWNKPKASN